MSEAEVPKKAEEAIVKAAPKVEKPVTDDPLDELATTIDQFMESMRGASVRSLRDILAKGKAKIDTVITKLDEDAGGDPPKKQD